MISELKWNLPVIFIAYFPLQDLVVMDIYFLDCTLKGEEQ